MAARYRILLFGVIALVLSGCLAQERDLRETDVSMIESTTVMREMAFEENGIGPGSLNERGFGPTYMVTFEVPETWVGAVHIRNDTNRLTFEYVVDEFTNAPLFTVEALSEAQYWEQIGSYPGQYNPLKNSADTYFIYNLPIDAYYSGLPLEEYEAFSADVPDIVPTFIFEAVGIDYFGR